MRLLLRLLKPFSGLVSQDINSAERKKIVFKMAIFFRSLKFAIGNKGNGSRTLLTASTSAFSIPYVVHPLLGLPCARLFPPLSRFVIPFQAHGPLFLSFPPWKLSQSATPLYLQGNAIVFQKVDALNLLHRSAKFPLNLNFISISSSPNLLHRIDFEDQRNDDVYGFLNLPNLISLARLFSGPLLGWVIANEWYSSAFMGLAVAGLSDWVDGYAARKLKINSVVGSYLDPLADKILIGCVALAMVHNDLLHPALVGLVVARDVFLVGGAVYQRASSSDKKWRHWHDFFNLDGTSSPKVEPLFISKVNTVLQLLLVAAALAQPEYGTIETQSYITSLSWLVASTTVASTAAYASQYMRKRCTLVATKS